MISALFENLIKYKFLVLLCLAGCIAYSFFLVNRATVDLSIMVEKRTFFKIYWAQANEGFSEKRSTKILVAPGKKNYHFLLTNLRDVKKIRIDPQEYTGRSVIEKIAFEQKGIKPILFSFKDGFSQFKELNQISRYHLEGKGLAVYSTGKDPYFVGDLTIEKVAFPWGLEFFRIGFLCFGIVIIYSTTKHLNTKLGYVPILMAVALTLVIIMAVISSEKNVHPDEQVHREASKYYQENWLPPSFEDPAIRSTYSVYGSSRLNKPEISYLFSGKFAKLISFLHIKPFRLFRLFNIFLFSCLLLYTIKDAGARAIAMPFLVSPQIWYVFSYCNSDAFALFISFLVGVQIVTPGSMFNVFLRQKPDSCLLIRSLLLGCLLGSLLLLKQNYYPYIVFVISVLVWQIWEMGSREQRTLVVKRMLIVSLIGLSLFGLRRGADYYVNGFDKADKLAKITVETAIPLYNPQTELSKKHLHLNMKKRGVPWTNLVNQKRFFEKSYRSLFGVYGNLTISAPLRYYDIVRWTGVALLFVFLGLILKQSWRENGFITVSFLLLSLALISASFYHSWTKDFQAQGRYLFPIVSMLSIVYARNHRYLNGRLFTTIFIMMFVLSAYSFIFVAIPQIPKSLLS